MGFVSLTLPEQYAGLFEYVERPPCESGCDIVIEWAWVFCPYCGATLSTE